MRLSKGALTLLACVALGGCASQPATTGDHWPAGATRSLGVGDVAALPGGGEVTYLGVASDSRCAPDVQCVWAGDADVRLQLREASGQTRVVSLHTQLQPRTQPWGTRALRIAELARGGKPRLQLALD